MTRLIVFLGAAFLLTTPAAHGSTTKPLVTIAEIQKWIESEVQDVPSLIKKLPERYRDFFVLQYETKSLHEATAAHPRILFYGPDARLVMAVSGKPDDPRHNTVEFIEYSLERSEFQFYELDFTERKLTQPEMCVLCHRGDLRPNWEPYDIWPGAYGSHHDTIPPRSKERAFFDEFLKSFPASDRYAPLKAAHLSKDLLASQSNIYTVGVEGVGMNSYLTVLLNYWNRDRMADRMAKSPLHDRYRNALAATVLQCADPIESFLPADLVGNHTHTFNHVLKTTRAFLEKDQDRRLKRAAKFQTEGDVEKLREHADTFGFVEPMVVETARLRYLLEFRKEGAMDLHDWSLGLAKSSYHFNDGVNGIANLAGHYLPKAFESGMVFPLDTLTLSLLPPRNGYENPMVSLHTVKEDQATCDRLKPLRNRINWTK